MNKAVYVVGGCAITALIVGYILESNASASTTPAAPSGGGGGSTSTSSAFPTSTSSPDTSTTLGQNSGAYLPTNANNVVAPYFTGYGDDGPTLYSDS
jgi:hypothetical protein